MSPATAVPVSVRYFAPPVTKIAWLAAILAPSLIPTPAEWGSRIDLSDEIADLSGFNITDEAIPTPGLSKFTGSLPGRLTVDKSGLTFYADEAGVDVRTILTSGQSGFVAIADAGDTAALLMDIFPARVGALGKPRSVSGSTAQLITVPIHVTREPAEDVIIPAAV